MLLSAHTDLLGLLRKNILRCLSITFFYSSFAFNLYFYCLKYNGMASGHEAIHVWDFSFYCKQLETWIKYASLNISLTVFRHWTTGRPGM